MTDLASVGAVELVGARARVRGGRVHEVGRQQRRQQRAHLHGVQLEARAQRAAHLLRRPVRARDQPRCTRDTQSITN